MIVSNSGCVLYQIAIHFSSVGGGGFRVHEGASSAPEWLRVHGHTVGNRARLPFLCRFHVIIVVNYHLLALLYWTWGNWLLQYKWYGKRWSDLQSSAVTQRVSFRGIYFGVARNKRTSISLANPPKKSSERGSLGDCRRLYTNGKKDGP